MIRVSTPLLPSLEIPIPTGTGSNPECYLSCLKGCAGKIEREHFIPENILLKLSDKKQITINRFLHGKTVTQTIGARDFSARVLCATHNRALSPLDANLGNFFDKLKNTPDHFSNGSPQKTITYRFNGHDIERSLLKILCGYVASGIAAHNDSVIPPTPPPKEYAEALFTLDTLPDGWGLYFLREVKAYDPIYFSPLMDQDKIKGILIGIFGISFWLMLGDPPLDLISQGSVYRPKELLFKKENIDKNVKIILDWQKSGSNSTVTFNYKQ